VMSFQMFLVEQQDKILRDFETISAL